MTGIKTMERMELMLLVFYWWHLSLIQGNLAIAYYSKTAMPPDLWNDVRPKNSVQHLILDSSEAVLLTTIVRETISFLNLFAKDDEQGEDNADYTGISWETLKSKSLNANLINSNTAISGVAGISYSI